MGAMLVTISAIAQVTPMVLGDKHAMLRVDEKSKYILLPVQETEEIAAIAVLDGSNNMVQRMNVKLAVDRVDYFVPYELKGAKLFDIEFHGDRRQKGAVSEFTCWKEITFAGMFYKDGIWHLYYQYNPYGSQWENMHWGHSTSKDLVHWEAQPLTFEPDWLGSIFSGSCITNGSDVVAFYTSAGHHQTQSMAVSKDNGLTFVKYEGNPVITSDKPDFRDPNVFWYESTKRWIMILAVGQEMQIYSSADLKDWKYESSFGQEYGNHSGVWECPDLFKLDDKWVLICNINPGGPFGGSATQYFVGQFDGHKFTCESMPKVTKWLDYGKDHYATVSFYNAPENRRVVMAWMSNWQYANQVPTKQFRSGNSIARDLGLFEFGEETYVSVVPSKEMLAARGAKLKQPTDACEIVVDVKGGAEIVLSNAKGEQVTMKYDASKQTFIMDRTKSGDVSFSAFDVEGKMAMTNLVFPSEPYNNIKVKGGKVTIYEIK